MEFLSPEWLEAMRTAAARRQAPDPDPIADVAVVIDQVVDDVGWRTTVDHGTITVSALAPGADVPGVRLTMARPTAIAIASGRRSVLDAFIRGDLQVGGDVQTLLDQQRALAEIDDVFAAVRAETQYPSDV